MAHTIWLKKIHQYFANEILSSIILYRKIEIFISFIDINISLKL